MDNSFDNPTQFRNPNQKPPANKLKNKKLGCGCGGIMLIAVFIVMYFLAYHLLFPSLFPKWLRGDLQGLVIFPSNDGKYKLWVQNDGSFSYIQETKSGGSHSIGRKGFFCKTYTYVYDPVSEDVMDGFSTNYDFLPQNPEMIYHNGKIFVIESLNGPAAINVYNTENYQRILTTEEFCAKDKSLASGLDKIYVDRKPPLKLNLTAKDGRNLVYSVTEDKFYSDYGAMSKYYREHDSTKASIFTLEDERNSNKRKKLYYITGPKGELYFSSPRGENLVEHQGRNREKLHAELMVPDKAFIDGELLYYDDDIAVIIHQDNVTKNTNRMLSCVDKSGKELWTIQQEDLFDEIKGEEDESFSDMFFIKSYMSAQRSGNVVVFIFRPEGAMGFDLASGKKLWEFDD